MVYVQGQHQLLKSGKFLSYHVDKGFQCTRFCIDIDLVSHNSHFYNQDYKWLKIKINLSMCKVSKKGCHTLVGTNILFKGHTTEKICKTNSI